MEIKLLVDPAATAGLEGHPVFAKARSGVRHERTTYFDTDDLALHELGFCLRIRKSGRQLVQTLSQAATGEAGLAQRHEWEWPIATDALDPGLLEQTMAPTKSLNGQFARAQPKFITDIRRRAYLLTLDEGTTVEAAFDRGTVVADLRREEVSELELEVKGGPPAPAFRLAMELAREYGLRIGAESKAARGYRLLVGTPPRAEKSRPVEICGKADVADALERLAGVALGAFVANMPAARVGDCEGVHQMRVALRRLRTVFVLLSPYLEANAKERFNAAIRDMGAVLGAARDWDVFAIETLSDVARAGAGEAVLSELRGAVAMPRQEAHAAVKRLIDGPRPTRWVLGLETWIASGEWRCAERNDRENIRAVLPDLLDRLRRKVNKRGRHLSRLSAPELHPLRKSVKKLRYAAESCTALYDPKEVDACVKVCKKLQSLLGNINDAAVSARLLQEIALSSQAVAAMRDWRDTQCAQASSKLGPTWDKFRNARPFWR